jgi:hypothetical protein
MISIHEIMIILSIYLFLARDTMEKFSEKHRSNPGLNVATIRNKINNERKKHDNILKSRLSKLRLNTE